MSELRAFRDRLKEGDESVAVELLRRLSDRECSPGAWTQLAKLWAEYRFGRPGPVIDDDGLPADLEQRPLHEQIGFLTERMERLMAARCLLEAQYDAEMAQARGEVQ